MTTSPTWMPGTCLHVQTFGEKPWCAWGFVAKSGSDGWWSARRVGAASRGAAPADLRREGATRVPHGAIWVPHGATPVAPIMRKRVAPWRFWRRLALGKLVVVKCHFRCHLVPLPPDHSPPAWHLGASPPPSEPLVQMRGPIPGTAGDARHRPGAARPPRASGSSGPRVISNGLPASLASLPDADIIPAPPVRRGVTLTSAIASSPPEGMLPGTIGVV
jgi:hypothetical protein